MVGDLVGGLSLFFEFNDEMVEEEVKFFVMEWFMEEDKFVEEFVWELLFSKKEKKKWEKELKCNLMVSDFVGGLSLLFEMNDEMVDEEVKFFVME